MNCQEALNLLYDVLDKEASDIDTAQVQAHLDKCHDCLKKYQVEGILQRFLDESLKPAKTDKCKDAIRRDILSRLDQIDTEAARQESSRRRSRFGGFGSTLALAAGLIFIVGGTYVGAGLYKHHKLYIPLEQAHWNDAEANASVNTDATGEAVSFAKAEQFNIGDTYHGFARIGGHLEDLMGMKMSHFLYKQGDKIVSIFVAPGSFPIPEDLETSAVTVNGIKMYDHNCRGCRLVYHREGNAVIIAATTDRTIDLLNFDPVEGAS